jgi:ribose 5-phosphate isomerase A
LRPRAKAFRWTHRAKLAAAKKAIGLTKPRQIVGLGSGSTVALAVKLLAERNSRNRMRIRVVPTSHQIEIEALRNGLAVTTLNEIGEADITIDGADQIEKQTLNLIKGGGGALAREKILAHNSRVFMIIADETKLSERLGESRTIPIEVLPYAQRSVTHAISRLGGKTRLREGVGKVGPVVTDNGNFIVDASFGALKDPYELDRKLHAVPGVVETGLFLNLADVAFVGTRSGAVVRLS